MFADEAGTKNLATGATVKKLGIKGGEEGAFASSEKTHCTPQQAVAGCKSKHEVSKAFDGKADTFWAASDVSKDQFIAVKFRTPVDILSVKIQLANPSNKQPATMGPSMFAVEKSLDGEHWARVRLVTSVGNWHKQATSFALPTLDTVPKSVFAIRSQVNPNLCLGVVPTFKPEDKEKKDPIDLSTDAAIELQICDDGKNQQFWQFMPGGVPMLQNAKDDSYVLHQSEKGYQVKRCVKEGCSDLKKNGGFAYASGAAGGLLRSTSKKNMILAAPKQVAAGQRAISMECGSAAYSAQLSLCEEKGKNARWELVPMFVLEEGVRAVACAPYSHSSVKPKEATSRHQAQALCAADRTCAAYNWAGRQPDGEGANPNQVFLCSALHEVHSGMKDWELGSRVGLLEQFEE